LHYFRYPVEVSADSYVIDARDFAHVFDLIGDL
jgi:hypothetical protein